MLSIRIISRSCFWQPASCLVACILLCQFARGQVNETPQTGSTDSGRNKPGKIQARGCLGHVLDEFHFASEDLSGWVVLTGNTAGLESYVDREVTLEGSKGEPIRIEGYFDPIQSFEVSRIVKVFEKAEPELAPDFVENNTWVTETNKKYGVRFAHPKSMTTNTETSPVREQSNFVTQQDTELVSSFEIPGKAYPNANLRSGTFTIFAKRNVPSQGGCGQFGDLAMSDEHPSSYAVGNLRYMRADGFDGGMGTWYLSNYFHIFRNGLCYELAFELVEYNAQNADTGCNIPLLSAEDNWDLIKPLVDSVSFFRPSVRPLLKSDARRPHGPIPSAQQAAEPKLSEPTSAQTVRWPTGPPPTKPNSDLIGVVYTVTGLTFPGAGPQHTETFQFTASNFITSSISLSASRLDSCVNCIQSGIAVQFFPNGTLPLIVPADSVHFTDADGIVYGWVFAPGAFSATGTYTAFDYPPYIVSDVATMTVRVVRATPKTTSKQRSVKCLYLWKCGIRVETTSRSTGL